MAEEEKKDFTIKDRRFSAGESSGSDKTAAASEKKQNQEKDADFAKREYQKKTSDCQQQKQFQMPHINFSTFVFSLNSSALVQFGLLEDPATGKKEKNLILAKQTIDILGMLEEKTKGNLTREEENMLKNILYDLRMIYVKEKSC